MMPPVACKTAKKVTPPNITVRNFGFIKTVPIITPAIPVETADAKIKLLMDITCLSKQFLYPINLVKKSKTTLAAVNPKKWVALGFNARVMIVAIIPVKVTAPSLLTYHKARIKEIIPSMSHRNGRWVALQKIGAIYALNTLHNAANNAIAVMSRLVKYAMVTPFNKFVLLFVNKSFMVKTFKDISETHVKNRSCRSNLSA